MLKEQRGGRCGCSRASEGERGRKGGRKGTGTGRAGPCGHQRDLIFYPNEGGPENPWMCLNAVALTGGYCREGKWTQRDHIC